MPKQNLTKSFLALIPFLIILVIYFIAVDWLRNIDLAFTQFVIQQRNAIGNTYFHFTTFLANEEFIWVSTIAAVLIFAVALKKWKVAITYGLAVAVGNLWLNPFIKDIFQRERPDPATQLVFHDSYSFPSGHSFAAGMIYPLLVYLLLRYTKLSKYARVIKIILIIVVLSIGFSRIYLGVHYLSDVIAGLSLGYAFYYLTQYVIERFVDPV